jgi:hypothetical protein
VRVFTGTLTVKPFQKGTDNDDNDELHVPRPFVSGCC